jgi:hypothetical protein
MKKRLLKFALIVCVSQLIISCAGGNGPKNVTLTTQKIEAYLNSYIEMREKTPQILSDVNTKMVDIEKVGVGDFEAICSKNGISFKDFVVLNAKVGAVYSILNAEDFMNMMGNMKADGDVQLDEGMKQMQAQIDDPNFPAEAKEEMKKALEEMKKNKAKINSEFEKNKEWADLVLDKTKSISNVFIDKTEAELVKQYFNKITEAYTGMAPSNFNVKY